MINDFINDYYNAHIAFNNVMNGIEYLKRKHVCDMSKFEESCQVLQHFFWGKSQSNELFDPLDFDEDYDNNRKTRERKRNIVPDEECVF